MYGDKGPPKGYSIPRHVTSGSGKKMCQECSSTDHWTFECPKKVEKSSSKRAAPRLSRTLMLKYGIKQKRTEFTPELTEREAYHKEMKDLEKTLIKEVTQEGNNNTDNNKRQRTEDVKMEPADESDQLPSEMTGDVKKEEQ